MKTLIIFFIVVSLVGCSSTKLDVKPEDKQTNVLLGPKIAGYKQVEYMNRNEVIQATKECINARLHPVVQYVTQKTEFGNVMLPAVVNCEVYTKP